MNKSPNYNILYGMGMRMDTGRNTDRNNGKKTMLDIVKDLVIQLSKYREIDDIIQEIQENKKKNKNFVEEDDDDLVGNVQGYLEQVQDIMSSGDEMEEYQEEEEGGYYGYYDRVAEGGNQSMSVSQLQYVE